MRWPWVGRAALDLAIDERDRLRQVNDHLTNQIVRIARKANAMPESTPGDGRKKTDIVVPEEVQDAADAWDSPVQKQLALQRAKQIYRATKSWERARQAIAVDGGE